MDQTDREILELLERDGRASYTEIGRRVSLSTAAVKRRVERLELDRIITGYTASVDHVRLGMAIEAFIELRFTGNMAVDDIWRSADDIPEVFAIYTMAGDLDALVHTRARDVAHLADVIARMRRKRHVIGTRTLIVMDSRSRAFTHA